MSLTPKSEALSEFQDAIIDVADGPLQALVLQGRELKPRIGLDFQPEILSPISMAKLRLAQTANDLDSYIGRAAREERQRVR